MGMFYNGNDPLLYNNAPSFQQSMNPNNLSDLYAQLYTQQKVVENQQQCVKDWIGELDRSMRELDSTTVERLNQDEKFVQLNHTLQNSIQGELMSLVKYKLNTNPGVCENVKRQMDIIKEISNSVKDTERKNIAELNDYMQNYSSMSFDEYKKMKNGGNKTNKKVKNNEQDDHGNDKV